MTAFLRFMSVRTNYPEFPHSQHRLPLSHIDKNSFLLGHFSYSNPLTGKTKAPVSPGAYHSLLDGIGRSLV